MEGDKFCTRCGKMLPEGSVFCPECGHQVGGEPGQGGNDNGWGYCGTYGDAGFERAKTGPSFAFIILLYGILAIFMGASDVVSGLGMNESTYQELIDMISQMLGMDASGYLPEWTPNTGLLMTLSSLFMLISGVLAVVCYYFCRKAKSWKTATILCAASAVAVLGMGSYSAYLSMGVMLFIFGAIVTFLVYSRKDTFSG